jgi:threonine aldolase
MPTHIYKQRSNQRHGMASLHRRKRLYCHQLAHIYSFETSAMN